MSKTLAELIDQAVARPSPEPEYRVGQAVRIRSTLEVNVHAIRDLLGAEGVVKRIQVSPIFKRVTYWVAVAGRVEPFEGDELDARYKRGHAS